VANPPDSSKDDSTVGSKNGQLSRKYIAEVQGIDCICIFPTLILKSCVLQELFSYGTLSNKSNGKDIEFEYNFHIILTIFEPC
jgi:hypothetical protein